MRIMEADAKGSATVSVGTTKEGREHVTRARVEFAEFRIIDPVDESTAIVGAGLAMNAGWHDLSLGERIPASSVEVVLPPTEIRDVGTFDAFLPAEDFAIVSGTGEIEARLEVDKDRIAVGRMALVAEEFVMRSGEVILQGDLELDATLAEGDLDARKFDLSGTTIRLENIVDKELSDRKQDKLDAWFCDVKLEQGSVTFGRPLTANGRVGVQMYDTRPLVALLKNLGVKLGGLSMMPNVKNIDGEMDIGFGPAYMEVDDLNLTGNKLEVLGWIHSRDKKMDGRLYSKYGILGAGIELDQGKAKVHLAKPRKWFEAQQGPPSPEVETAAAAGQ
jgi:hypothetical protein